MSEAIVPRTVGQTATKEPAALMTDGQTDRLRASAELRTDDHMWPRNVEAGRGTEAVEAVAGFWARYMTTNDTGWGYTGWQAHCANDLKGWWGGGGGGGVKAT